MLEAYYSALFRGGVRGYDFGDLLLDYRRAVASRVIVPMWQWRHGLWARLWYGHLERICAAYEDQKCDEVFGR